MNCKILCILGLMLTVEAQASSTQPKLFPYGYYTHQENINNSGAISSFQPYNDRDVNYGLNNSFQKSSRNIYSESFMALWTANHAPRNRTPSRSRRRVLAHLMPNFSIDSDNGLLDPSYRFVMASFNTLSGEVHRRRHKNAGKKYKTLSRKTKNNTFQRGGIVVTAASMLLIISVGVYTRVTKSTKRLENGASSNGVEGCMKCLRLDFSIIKVATNNFSKKNKIGQSKIGVVYKGTLPNGQGIAVRKLNQNTSQWPQDYSFNNVVIVGSKFLHRNLIKIFGFCSEGDDRFLIYEFIPMSLDGLLFDRRKIEDTCLNWEKRYKIIKGIASALIYLHEDSGLAIANGDIRASKVLLDEKLNPKILCFGPTKFVGVSQSDQVSTRFGGILEYLDPEYFKSGVITLKSDVFSFGVLLLEIISGKKSECFRRSHSESLISYASRIWSEGTALSLVDSRLISNGTMESEIFIRCIHVALLCVQAEANSRPTMSSVFLFLNCNYSLPLPTILSNTEYSEQAFETNEVASSDSESSDHSSNSFVSALDFPLSPTSETESSCQVNKGFFKLRRGILARLRCFNLRGIGSICRKFGANGNEKDYGQMQHSV